MISVLTKNRFNYAFILFFIINFQHLSAQCSITIQPSNATTCSGGNISFSHMATGTIIGYQWQVNTGSGFTNIINNAVYSNATTSSLNITGANSTFNGYTYQCLVYNSCGGDIPSDIKTLTITPNTWTGVTSTDWHDASNWSCGAVPTNQDDVDIIMDVFFTANEPTINSGMQANCRNLLKMIDLYEKIEYSTQNTRNKRRSCSNKFCEYQWTSR